MYLYKIKFYKKKKKRIYIYEEMVKLYYYQSVMFRKMKKNIFIK